MDDKFGICTVNAKPSDDKFRIYTMATGILDDPENFDRYYRRLSPWRREAVDRTKPVQKKKQSVAAGILLDEGLKEYGLKEADMRIENGDHGKPFFADAPEIHFNLSHSGNMAMAVFSQTESGCDIEQIKKSEEKIARHFFCPEEYAWIKAVQDENEEEIRFYRLWTLKESLVKALGTGLAVPLNTFCFHMDGESVTLQWLEVNAEYAGYDSDKYEFMEYEFRENESDRRNLGIYRAAVCLKS